MKISGVVGALIEVVLFAFSAYKIKQTYMSLYLIHNIAYYWLMFTILTGIWEFTYVTQKKRVAVKSLELIENKEHVWTKEYSILMIFPSNLARIFYSEYAAYADREYMSLSNRWSLAIEGTHCCLCGLFSLICIKDQLKEYYADWNSFSNDGV